MSSERLPATTKTLPNGDKIRTVTDKDGKPWSYRIKAPVVKTVDTMPVKNDPPHPKREPAWDPSWNPCPGARCNPPQIGPFRDFTHEIVPGPEWFEPECIDD